MITPPEANQEQQKPSTNITAGDWDSKSFTFNGNNFVLESTSFADFVNGSGYMIDDDNISLTNGYLVNPGEYKSVSMALNEDDWDTYLYVKAYNNTNEAIDIKDCVILAVDFEIDYCLEENTPYKSMNVAGIEIGKIVDVMASLGMPESMNSGDDYVNYTYISNEVYFDIEVNSNGVVTGIQYDADLY